MKIHWVSEELQGPLCKARVGELNWNATKLPQEVDCKRCKTKMCEDCHGTGIMNGHEYGIYCSCEYGEIRELIAYKDKE